MVENTIVCNAREKFFDVSCVKFYSQCWKQRYGVAATTKNKNLIHALIEKDFGMVEGWM